MEEQAELLLESMEVEGARLRETRHRVATRHQTLWPARNRLLREGCEKGLALSSLTRALKMSRSAGTRMAREEGLDFSSPREHVAAVV